MTDMILYAPIINESQRHAWESYSAENQEWLAESLELACETSTWFDSEPLHGTLGANTTQDRRWLSTPASMDDIAKRRAQAAPAVDALGQGLQYKDLYNLDGDSSVASALSSRYAPTWHISPPTQASSTLINYNLFADPELGWTANSTVVSQGQCVLSKNVKLPFLFDSISPEDSKDRNDENYEGRMKPVRSDIEQPRTAIVVPIRNGFSQGASVVGIFFALLSWDTFLARIIPDDGSSGCVYAVLENSCNQVHTYSIDGPTATYLGEGDLHETSYDKLRMPFRLKTPPSPVDEHGDGQCGRF